MPDDFSSLDEETLQIFIADTEEILNQLDDDIYKLDTDFSSGKKLNPEILNNIFRGAHTLKGNAGMFGLNEMQILTHSLENLLDRLRLGKTNINRQIIDLLIQGSDLLKKMLTENKPGVLTVESLSRALDNMAEGEVIEDQQVSVKIQPKPAEKQAEAKKTQQVPEIKQPAQLDQQKSAVDAIKKEISPLLDLFLQNQSKKVDECVANNLNVVIVFGLFSPGNYQDNLFKLINWLKQYGDVISVYPLTPKSMKLKVFYKILFSTSNDLIKFEQVLDKNNIKLMIISERR